MRRCTWPSISRLHLLVQKGEDATLLSQPNRVLADNKRNRRTCIKRYGGDKTRRFDAATRACPSCYAPALPGPVIDGWKKTLGLGGLQAHGFLAEQRGECYSPRQGNRESKLCAAPCSSRSSSPCWSRGLMPNPLARACWLPLLTLQDSCSPRARRANWEKSSASSWKATSSSLKMSS